MQEDRYGITDIVDADIHYVLFLIYIKISGFLSLLFMIINIANRRPLINILLPLVIILLCIGWYKLAKIERFHFWSRISFMSFLTFIYIPFGYWTSPGSTSAMLYLCLLVTFILAVVAVNKWEYIFPIIIIIETLLMLRTEIWFPTHYYKYTDEIYRINDISINYGVVALAITLTIVYMMQIYNKHNQKLYEISVKDSLTGLYNRRYFSDYVQKEYDRFIRLHQIFSIVLLDINHFKKVNDQYGHQTGDQVLKDVARIIIENIRNYDICARYGGDEFILVLPNTNEKEAIKQVDRMMMELKEYFKKYGDIYLDVAFGVTDSQGKTITEIIQFADQRLYIDKASKKENIVT